MGLLQLHNIGASGKIITAFDIVRTMALGADWCSSARGFMFALGCIQSRFCHGGRCATGAVRRILHNEVRLVSNIIRFLKPGDLLENRADHPVYATFWKMAFSQSFTPVNS